MEDLGLGISSLRVGVTGFSMVKEFYSSIIFLEVMIFRFLRLFIDCFIVYETEETMT